MKIYRFRIALFSVLFLLVIASLVSARSVRVAISGGYDEISAIKDDNLEYISLSEFAGIIGGSLDWEMVGHQVSYRDYGFTFSFVIGSPFFKMNDSVFNMTYPALLNKGQLYVYPETFLPFLDRVTSRKITWDSRKREIRVDAEYFNVTDISFAPKANGLLIDIFLTAEVKYDLFVTEGNYLNVSIRDGRLNTARIESRRDSRFMYRLNAYQVENNTGQISIRLKRPVEKWTHKLVYDPPRIQISIADPNFQLTDAETDSPIDRDEKIDVVVVDAGHGGEDYGAIGSGGTREKDVTLDIARELARLIRKDKQFKVVMTRDRDRTVTLDERATIANDAGADLFISIHCNASPKKDVRGWNVFFLAPTKNDFGRATEQLENSYFLRESRGAFEAHMEKSQEDDPIDFILSEMLMTEFQVESHELAMMIDREFRRKLSTKGRGIDQAGFFVLNKIYTPSVLIESAFISNKQEENLLKSKSYHSDVAEAIYAALERFKAKYEGL